MKINELEKTLNISRANIRFYEKEGLLNPERKDNGYREYDENEIAILKKIIIYRKLGISISNIKDIFNGTLALSDAINDSMNSINSELTELVVSARVCKDLQIQRVDNLSFDENYYWNEIKRMESLGEEFYDFVGTDVSAFEQRPSDTKYKIALGITSVALLIFTVVVGLSRFGLVLVEYGSMIGFSELHHLPVIQALTPVCLILTVAFVIGFIFVHQKSVENGKIFWTLYVIGILIAGIVICFTILISYENSIFDEKHANIALSDEEAIKIDDEYKKYFPYYDDMYEYVGVDFNYFYSRCEISNAVHIHIQNFSWFEDDVLYDMEYFETKDSLLMNQYSMQKGAPVIYGESSLAYPGGVTKTINNMEYLIHQYENYYEIRIIDEVSYFSIVLRDFNEMKEVSEAEFTEVAIQQYELVKLSAKNSKGVSRKLIEQI